MFSWARLRIAVRAVSVGIHADLNKVSGFITPLDLLCLSRWLSWKKSPTFLFVLLAEFLHHFSRNLGHGMKTPAIKLEGIFCSLKWLGCSRPVSFLDLVHITLPSYLKVANFTPCLWNEKCWDFLAVKILWRIDTWHWIPSKNGWKPWKPDSPSDKMDHSFKVIKSKQSPKDWSSTCQIDRLASWPGARQGTCLSPSCAHLVIKHLYERTK